MNTEQLQAGLYEAAKAGAVGILEEDGRELVPFVLALDDTGLQAIQIPNDRDSARRCLAFAAAKLRFFATVGEFWTATIAPEDRENFDPATITPPSERPDRRECVLVTLYADGRQVCTASREFTRASGVCVLEPEWTETGMEGADFVPLKGGIFPT